MSNETNTTAAANTTAKTPITLDEIREGHEVIAIIGTEKDVRQFALCQIAGTSQHYILGTDGFDSRTMGDRAGYMKAAMHDRARWLVFCDRNPEAAAKEKERQMLLLKELDQELGKTVREVRDITTGCDKTVRP